ncbi:hypothetical protein NP511_13545 [Natrinema thermotolerans]|uniref:Uncharacterized protein n=1 Tax=Natrinema thermotolerans TaxID=121872 RepID=A0AAF0T0R0_9EURY|nr:hypothetical protein [Natrinema thermotolerans]QCC59435.1 hypothetical protein DVR14_12675 [Natrinema thermotolerans]WMT06407.1 hypothetical protein NP511_13545 [Natrinema thermotolerans]
MPDAHVTEPEFARTYDGGAYDDAWAAVKQYRRVIAYHRDNPDAGIAELMRISGAARNSVVSWIDDGATPLVAQGLYKAHDYKLLGVDYDEITPLNILVAAALSAGTIDARNYQPTFTVESLENSLVVNSLELIGVGSQELENGTGDAPTVGPAADAAIIGRALHVLGVPLGSKTNAGELSLPSYLEDAPDAVRKRFVDIYLENRGQPHVDNAGLAIKEDRPRTYQEQLASLIESVAGESVTVADSGVMVSADAARALGFEQPETV